MEEAYKEIKFMREHDRVLSAWIDIYDNEEKKTIFHECYVDAFGYISK